MLLLLLQKLNVAEHMVLWGVEKAARSLSRVLGRQVCTGPCTWSYLAVTPMLLRACPIPHFIPCLHHRRGWRI